MGNAYPPQFLKKGKEKMFRDNLRLEEIYFSKLRGLIAALGKFQNGDNPEEIRVLLDSCIEANGAILLLYKNIGEAWNETTAMIQNQGRKLEELKTSLDSFDSALNEKVDDINNYLNSQIGYLDSRVSTLEARPAIKALTMTMTEEQTPDGIKFVYHIWDGETEIVDFNTLKTMYYASPLILYYDYEDDYEKPCCGFASLGELNIGFYDKISGEWTNDYFYSVYWVLPTWEGTIKAPNVPENTDSLSMYEFYMKENGEVGKCRVVLQNT